MESLAPPMLREQVMLFVQFSFPTLPERQHAALYNLLMLGRGLERSGVMRC